MITKLQPFETNSEYVTTKSGDFVYLYVNFAQQINRKYHPQ